MTKIALFGTSADPPTAGHQMILTWLSNYFDLVAVWAADNPFKPKQTSLEHRSKMLDLLIQEMPKTRDNIYLFPELSHPRTIITLERAKNLWQKADFTLVIGADLVTANPHHQGLPIMNWYKASELLKQVKLLIIPRIGYNINQVDLQQLEKHGAKWAIADLKAPPVSSTSYREKGEHHILPFPIIQYINQQKLYAYVRQK
jgi:nicotinate-nucleotide adenylyltransferase